MAFFNSDNFIDIATRPNEILLETFMLSLEIESERALYLHNEGYKTSDDFGLPKLFIRSTYTYSVPSVAETSFNPTDYQRPTIPTSPSTLKQRPVEFPLHWVVSRWLAFNDSPPPAADSDDDTEKNIPTASFDASLMTWFGPKNPYQTGSYAFIWLQTNQKQVILLKYPPQEPTNKPVPQEEPMDNTESDIPKWHSQGIPPPCLPITTLD